MSVRIRLSRIGRPHEPYYRLVATSRQSARDGKPVEILGTLNPRQRSKPETLNVDRLRYWLSVGAKPTDTVVNTLKIAGVWDQVKPGSSAPQSKI